MSKSKRSSTKEIEKKSFVSYVSDCCDRYAAKLKKFLFPSQTFNWEKLSIFSMSTFVKIYIQKIFFSFSSSSFAQIKNERGGWMKRRWGKNWEFFFRGKLKWKVSYSFPSVSFYEILVIAELQGVGTSMRYLKVLKSWCPQTFSDHDKLTAILKISRHIDWEPLTSSCSTSLKNRPWFY